VHYKGADASVFEEYVAEMVSFAKAWGLSRCYLQIYNPTDAPVFAASSVASNFLDPLHAANIEAGFLAYINQKDTDWDRSDPLRDVAAYIKEVEKAASGGGMIKAVAFDKEDLGSMGATLSEKITSMRQSGIISATLELGYAGSASLFSQEDQPAVQNLCPELYWYGELAPHHDAAGTWDCSQDCVTAMPCFSGPCVSTPYRAALNKPADMVDAMAAHLQNNGLTQHVAANGRAPGRTVWALLSLEHLAGCCPERVYGPKDECGTFDGFALWDRDSFLEMLDKFATHYGFNTTVPMPIGLYEFQFIPPHWRDPKISADAITAQTTSMASPTECLPQ